MKVEFYKTGERRYAIKIVRKNLPDLEMNPAPGFDDLMPHDLCHLIVEQCLRIENGIFGQIAQGGTAGSFRNMTSEISNSKEDLRRRRKDKQKGKKLVKENTDDLAKSERATYVCWQNWLAHSPIPNLKRQSEEMRENAENILKQMSAAERAAYTQESFSEIRARMDELSLIWSNLKLGETMVIDW